MQRHLINRIAILVLASLPVAASAQAATFQFRHASKGLVAASAAQPPVAVPNPTPPVSNPTPTPTPTPTPPTPTPVPEPEPTRIYATWNPADKGATIGLSNGNLTMTGNTQVGDGVRANKGVSSGKWYWETRYDSGNATYTPMLGVVGASTPLREAWRSAPAMLMYINRGFAGYASGILFTGSNSYTVYPNSLSPGVVIGTALDLTSNTITFYQNGVSLGTKPIAAGTWYPFATEPMGGPMAVTANFGATPFAYPVPSGFTPGPSQPGTP